MYNNILKSICGLYLMELYFKYEKMINCRNDKYKNIVLIN